MDKFCEKISKIKILSNIYIYNLFVYWKVIKLIKGFVISSVDFDKIFKKGLTMLHWVCDTILSIFLFSKEIRYLRNE